MISRAVLLAILVGCHAGAGSQAVRGLTLVVAAGGDDTANGVDRPLATLEGARDAIRRIRADHGLPAGGVTVIVRGGTYERDRPFRLEAQDSGTVGAPIEYRGAPGETVRIVGGRRLSALAVVRDPSVLERLAPEARAAVRVVDLKAQGIEDYGSPAGGGLELYAAHQRLPLARWPDEGYTRIADVPASDPVEVRGIKGDRSGRFTYEGDRPGRWVHEPDAWVHGFWFWDWADDRERVASIDPEHREIQLAAPLHHYGYRKGQWFYAYNLLAELDRPGEWYLDRVRGLLYVWPIEGEELVVSVADAAVTMDAVSNVTLRDLTFEAVRGTAITIHGGARDAIAGCTIVDTGAWAVSVVGGTEHDVEHCEISATGLGGVSVDGGDRAGLVPGGHRVISNHIHHYSQWQRTRQPAISIAGVGHEVAFNSIHDAPHGAIVFGGNDHVIEHNDIHDVCQETNDAGAIYAGRDWTMRGTVIRNNILHDIQGREQGGCNGVYLDDMFSGTTVTANIFERVTRGVFIGGGRDNVVTHNVFVGCQHGIHVDARGLGWAAYSVPAMQAALTAVPYQSAAWTARYPSLATITDHEPAAPRGNVFDANLSAGGIGDEIEPAAQPFVTAARSAP